MLRNLFLNGFDINDIIFILIRIVVVLLAISVHEMAHGFAAYKLGDNTAKYDGRLSLNPLRHIDPYGALCMLLFGFGWARPVMVNPNYFKNNKRDMAITALAGPISNFIMAFIGMFGLLYLCRIFTNIYIYWFFYMLVFLNISLGIFNLIPIPPLDGSKIFLSLLPRRIYYEIMRYEQFGFIVLIIALYLNVLDPILNIGVNAIYTILFYLAGGGLL